MFDLTLDVHAEQQVRKRPFFQLPECTSLNAALSFVNATMADRFGVPRTGDMVNDVERATPIKPHLVEIPVSIPLEANQ